MKIKEYTEALYDTALVTKRNVLNEIRNNNMTLQELRFFSIYLSKINPQDKSSRIVRFPLSDFQKIMGIGSDMNIQFFRNSIRRLLQQIVEVPNENGNGYTAFQLFKRCRVERDEEDNQWYVEIDAHDDSLPLMFDFKKRYFKYELWNALRLHSSNQLRMYEILKQYESIGRRELKILELRELLGITPDEYPRWDNFKVRVLDSCQQALAENTDICFTYERGRAGKGGKWLTVVFHIVKNENYIDQLTLDEFIAQQITAEDIEIVPDEEQSDPYGDFDLYADACGKEFSPIQMQEIFAIICTMDISPYMDSIDLGRYHYLYEKYAALNATAEKKRQKGQKPIVDRYKYFLKLIQNDRDSE